MSKKFYTLKNDLVFKNVFLKSPKRIKWLLDGILNMNIEIYNISNCELYKDRLYIRSKTVDSIIDTNYAYINIELNDTFNDNKKIRNFYYQTSYLNQLVHIKEDYVSIDKPIIQINFNVNQNKTKHLISKYTLINEYYTVETYLDIIYILNIDVARIVKFWYNNLNKEKEYFKNKLNKQKENTIKISEHNKIKKEIENSNDKKSIIILEKLISLKNQLNECSKYINNNICTLNTICIINNMK